MVQPRTPQPGSRVFAAILSLALVALAACSSSSAPPVPAQGGASSASPVASRPPSSSPAAGAPSNAVGDVPDCPPSGSATALTGAGATFPAPLYTRWFADYNTQCRVQINYQAIGSGGGISQHTNKTVDFGASDGILTQAQFDAAPGTVMIPMTSGAEAIIINVPGVSRGQLKLTPDALAGIFLGDITKWNDPKIASANPGVSLPNQDIVVVHRSDGSGTTFIFTDYLSKVSPAWQQRVGSGTSVNWPTGLGGEQNAGVAGQVQQLPGAIGYVELAYAMQNNMTWASLQNAGGKFLEPSIEGTTVAMRGVTLPDNMQVMLTNSSDPDAYPIAGFTWVLVYQDQTDKAKAQALTHFLWWGLHGGQKEASELMYAPLSPEAVTKAEALVRSIKADGQPALP